MKILDESHYYPFGLKHNKYSAAGFIWSPAGVIIAPIANNPFKYKFQSQELQDELGLNWYSYRYRNYDPAIGRFFNVDPLSESFAYNGVYNFSENRVVDAFELEGLESVVVNGEEQSQLTGSDLTDFNQTIDDVGGEFVDFTGDGNVDILGLNEAVVTGSVPQETQFKNNGLSTWIFDNVTVSITDFTQPLRDATAWTPERIIDYNQIMSESGVQAQKEHLSSTMTALGENGLIGSGMWSGNLGRVYGSTKALTNPVPNRLARVIPANIDGKTLGAPGALDVFVTAADDIKGLNATQISNRLTIPYSKYGFKVIEFDTPKFGISSPVNRNNPGFVGFGKTAGGAREFTIPNQPIPNGSIIKIIK